MAELPEEVFEQILVRLDVKDLIRYSSVSKSWKSLIADPKFIKSHLEHGYRRDQENVNFGNRRIVMSSICFFDMHHLFGSSNGLVCVSTSRTDYFVINPETREVNKLKKPNFPVVGNLVYGFGYDASIDDYKVVLGVTGEHDLTSFKILSLKSNTWGNIGDLNYTCLSKIGILLNGRLHWVAYRGSPLKNQKLILAYDFCEGKCTEIPQPCDKRYWSDATAHSTMRLGIIDDCLCVFRPKMLPYNIWVMKDYGVKQSWDRVVECNVKSETVHILKELKYYIPKEKALCHEHCWSVETPEFVGSLLYMPSLVSPQVCRKPRKKRSPSSYKKTGKVPSLCFQDFPTGSSSTEGNLEGQQSKHLQTLM